MRGDSLQMTVPVEMDPSQWEGKTERQEYLVYDKKYSQNKSAC